MTFEDALQRLEEIVAHLESGEQNLEQSMKLFEEGVALARTCQQLLDESEAKVERLLMDGSTEPLPELDPDA